LGRDQGVALQYSLRLLTLWLVSLDVFLYGLSN
jgi:hypothetical protein